MDRARRGAGMIDLDAYFGRIGYAGPRSITPETLSAVIGHHVVAVPFENLDVLQGREIRLDPASINDKIVISRRGGYCFEQNGLLMAVLEQMGFQVTPLAARVRIAMTREQLPPRTHMFLRVDIGGVPWMADVGVGSLTPTAALRLDTEAAQQTPHETHRIVGENGRFFHQALMGDGWVDIHEFTGESMPPIDRQLANWWTSTNPGSKFRLNLMVAIVGPKGTRAAIQNRRFTRRRGAETLETREIASPEELLELLKVEFGLRFEAGTRFDAPGAVWPA
jgi:N-hydroxyarylamine O-acetyltransferase